MWRTHLLASLHRQTTSFKGARGRRGGGGAAAKCKEAAGGGRGEAGGVTRVTRGSKPVGAQTSATVQRAAAAAPASVDVWPLDRAARTRSADASRPLASPGSRRQRGAGQRGCSSAFSSPDEPDELVDSATRSILAGDGLFQVAEVGSDFVLHRFPSCAVLQPHRKYE